MRVRPAAPTVDCFHWKNGREADIVVRGDDFTLVIENKVDADESPEQCEDLYLNFRDEPGALFLFLTPDGRAPTTASTQRARTAFKAISWPQVRTLIEQIRACSDPDSKSTVLDNYLLTLNRVFDG